MYIKATLFVWFLLAFAGVHLSTGGSSFSTGPEADPIVGVWGTQGCSLLPMISRQSRTGQCLLSHQPHRKWSSRGSADFNRILKEPADIALESTFKIASRP